MLNFKWSDSDFRETLRALFRNAGTLLLGNFFAALLGLASLSIAGRTLGPKLFGVLVLITTYVSLIDNLFNFQSWQALIKFGSEALANDRRKEYKALVKFSFCLDAGSALFSTFLAVFGAILFGSYLGWDEETSLLAAGFSLVILSNVSGAPTAVLRMFGKYRFLSINKLFGAISRLLLILLAYSLDSGFEGYLFAWFAAQALQNMLLLLGGWLELKKQRLNNFLSVSMNLLRGAYKNRWSFVLTTNLHSSVRLGTTTLDTIIVGTVLGPAAAGGYKIIKQFAGIITMVSGPLYQAVYPDLAKLWSYGSYRQFKQVLWYSGVLIGGVVITAWIFFAVLGKDILLLTVGPMYLDVYGATLVYMLGATIAATTFSFQPAMLAMGYAMKMFNILCFSTVVYLPLLFCLSASYGLVGAASAFILFYLLWVLLTLPCLINGLRSQQGQYL